MWIALPLFLAFLSTALLVQDKSNWWALQDIICLGIACFGIALELTRNRGKG